MNTRRPSLAEEWFIEDGLKALEALCDTCRTALLKEIALFDANPSQALSDVYRLSRAIRIKRIQSEQFEAAQSTDDWEALRVMRLIRFMITMASVQFEPIAEMRRAA